MLKSLLFNKAKDYRNYRWFYTSEGKLVIGGKSDEQNEEALKNFLKKEFTLLHTTNPGSPFMIIQSKNPSKNDIKETAVFCACFSKQWKEIKPNQKISIDIFKGNQIYKLKTMKKGTFGVKGEKQTMQVKPELILIVQKGKLRAVPNAPKEEKLLELKPGKLNKTEAIDKISKKIKDKFHFPISKEEIAKAIPSDKISVK